MMNKSSTFISGVLAFSIYFSFILLLIIYFNTRDLKKTMHFVKKNEDRIRISISSPEDTAKIKTKKPVTKKIVKKKPKAKKETVKKETVKKKKIVKKKVIKEKIVKKPKKVKKQDIDTIRPKKVNKPKSLFDNINTKKELSKPEKSIAVKNKPSASEMLSNSLKVQKTSDRGIENAYFARIEEKLKGWPAQSEYAGEMAKVWLKVEPNGLFVFKVITASGNEDFNIGLLAYLRQLQSIGFGPHRGERAYELNVEFVATD